MAEPFRTWGRMFGRMSPKNGLYVVPPWLLGVLGGVTAAVGDMRGSVPLTVVGFCIFVPAFFWFAFRVARVLFGEERDPERRSPH